MTKPKKDTQIILATSEELKAYVQAKRDKTTKAEDFCQYLKATHHSHATEVIADLSGQTFAALILNKIDLGNIIAGRRNGKSTQFQNCELKGTKLRSNASMEGLEFTHCVMEHASIAADLNGVNFGIDSKIDYINLKEAHNIDKCIIHSACNVSHVEVGFHDLETFQAHMANKIGDQRIDQQNNIAHQAEILRRNNVVPGSPDIDVIIEASVNPGAQIGVPAAARAVVSGALGAFNALLNVSSAALSAVGAGLTTNVTIGADAPQNEVRLHQNAIERIIANGPKFSPTLKNISPSKIGHVTKDVVEAWIEANKGVEKGEQISLNEFARIKMDWDDKEVPHLQNLDLKGLDFSGLEFGDVVLSKCDLSNAKFNQCSLDSVSLRDCNLSDTEFVEASAKHADFTRCAFNGAKIAKSDFTNAILVDADFSQGYKSTEISDSNFDYVDIRSAKLDRAKLESIELNYANMQNVTGDALILFNVKLEQTNLSNAALTNVVMREVDFTNSIAQNASFQGGVLERVTMTEVKAQSINLDNTSQNNVTYTNTNLSNSTMNEAQVGNVTIDDSQMVNMQAQQMQTYNPPLSTIPEESVATQELRSVLDNMTLKETNISDLDTSYDPIMIDAVSDALEAKQQQPTTLTINKADARGLDISGGHLVGVHIKDSDLSHSDARNIVIQDGDIEDTNLHGSNFSGTGSDHSEFINTTLKDVNATNSDMQGMRAVGGEWDRMDVSGAILRNTNIGAGDSKVDIHDLKADATTNFAGSHMEVLDTKVLDQEVQIKVTDIDDKVVSMTPEAVIEQSNEVEAIMANTATNVVASGISRVAETLNTGAAIASRVTTSLATHKKSRMGLVVGILMGIVVGGIIAGIAASTFGLGLIPIAIVAGVAVGSGAIGGGIAGSLIQNTNTGRGVAAIATAAAAATFLGPIGLVVAPVMALYNAITGKNSPLRSAFGSALDAVVANPLRRVAGFVASITPSEVEVIAAQRIGQTRTAGVITTQSERGAVKAIASPNVHEQTVAVAAQVTANQQHAPAAPDPKPNAVSMPQPSGPASGAQKIGWWASKLKKAKPTKIEQKQPKSHEATVTEERANAAGGGPIRAS